MKIQGFNTNLSNIIGQIALRCDPKYCHFWDIQEGIPIKTDLGLRSLKDLLIPYRKKMILKGELEEERPIIELADVEKRTSIVLYDEYGKQRMTAKVESTKLDFADCDIVFNKLEPYLGKILVNDPSQNMIGTSEWIPLKFKSQRINSLFIKYLFLTPPLLEAYWKLRSGKRHARIREWDLIRVALPIPDIEIQNRIADKIKVLEQEMMNKHHSLKKPVDVINEVFARKFDFNLEQYKRLEKNKTFKVKKSNFAVTTGISCGTKNFNPQYDYLRNIIKRHECVKLRENCLEPIRKGVVPLYVADGGVLVLKTANLKHGYLSLEQADYSNQEYYEYVKEKAGVKNGDIIVSCHGEGRGKVDIFELDIPAFVDTNTAIVRINPNKMGVFYVLYFIQSILGAYQFALLESETKAVRYMKPEKLGELKIIKVKNEEGIVEELKEALGILEKQRKDIETIRDKIDEVILNEVKA